MLCRMYYVHIKIMGKDGSEDMIANIEILNIKVAALVWGGVCPDDKKVCTCVRERVCVYVWVHVGGHFKIQLLWVTVQQSCTFKIDVKIRLGNQTLMNIIILKAHGTLKMVSFIVTYIWNEVFDG